MTEALAIAMALVKLSSEIFTLVEQAQQEGRDLTPDELTAVRQRRDTANQRFEQMLNRGH